MNVAVFTGPTLSRQEVQQVIEAECLPPVAQGDVYRVALTSPAAIGIIDGYFERIPSVWHKEMLWAMSQGIHVFGSASLGALRAAELEPFGMVGVGEIFKAFRDGVLEDDDEVAVVHGPTEESYRFSSEAMVNIRATLARARDEAVVALAVGDALLRIAKDLYYAERSWPQILEVAGSQQIPKPDLDRLRAWLPTGAVNQKREDALAMLRTMRAFLEAAPAPMQVSFTFEETLYWEQFVVAEADRESPEGPDEQVLQELQRDPEAVDRAETAALALWLAGQLARRDRWEAKAADVLAQAEAFCQRRGITHQADLAHWLERNHACREDLERWLHQDAIAGDARQLASGALARYVLDYLRRAGDYATLLERAQKPPASRP
jgi:hypothetical protein